MPVYKYVCHGCNYEIREIMTIAEKDKFNPGKCPSCNKKLFRDFSIGMVTGGGGGWCGKSSNICSPEKRAERKRKGDAIRKEMGLGHLND